MANSKSADKRARQNKSRYELKHAQRSIVRSAVKRIIKDVENKDKNLKDNLKLAQSTIDKIADKKVIHKNKAARLKSRLNRKVKSA
ncbi:30S ribosomal protein S20 [SAR86 cluster bacterium]|jgi:small subunit ribosomal protein S20|nr:30S ribosomal protein S20 [SAR86 cluster bacterium]